MLKHLKDRRSKKEKIDNLLSIIHERKERLRKMFTAHYGTMNFEAEIANDVIINQLYNQVDEMLPMCYTNSKGAFKILRIYW